MCRRFSVIPINTRKCGYDRRIVIEVQWLHRYAVALRKIIVSLHL